MLSHIRRGMIRQTHVQRMLKGMPGRSVSSMQVLVNHCDSMRAKVQTKETRSYVPNGCEAPSQAPRCFSTSTSTQEDDERALHTSPHTPIREIGANETQWDVIREASLRYGQKTAMIDAITGDEVTYDEFRNDVEHLAKSFYKEGIRKGTVVLTNAINCLEYPVMYHALTSLGAILSPASPQFLTEEVHYQLEASEASYLITHEDVRDYAIEAAEQYGIDYNKRFCIGKSYGKGPNSDVKGSRAFSELLRMDVSDIEVPKLEVKAHEEINLLPFSSGTTGRPKGVMLSYASILANLLQISAVEDMRESPALLVLPMYHIYPFLIMNLGLYEGSPLVVLPRFEPNTLLSALETYKIQKGHVVPPLVVFLSKHPDVESYDLSATKLLISAAAPLGAETTELLKDRLDIDVIQAYGMTELSPLTNYDYPDKFKQGSVGPLAPSTECRIVDADTGEDIPVGCEEPGELYARGPQVMLGYLNNEKATNETLMSDGFIRTGDMAYVDEDGYLFIVDRKKELIKYKGHQIAPAELENVVLQHEAVADAACVRGIRQDDGEEIPVCYVVLKENYDESDSMKHEIMEFVGTKVAPFKRVRAVEFIEKIPKTASGKLLRRKLQALQQ